MIKILEDEVKQAYIYWKMEENRDRGYNFHLCQELRADYEALRDTYEQQTGTKFTFE